MGNIGHLTINSTPYDLTSVNDEELASAITAMNAVVNNKVDKEAGKGLSTNDYTTAEKDKLAGIEEGAQVNPDMSAYATRVALDALAGRVTGTENVNDRQDDDIGRLMRELFVYGVEYDDTVGVSSVRRIGNMALHQSLPIQSKMKGCLLSDNGVVLQYLPESDWTSVTRDGTAGQVMVEIPGHYVLFETEGHIHRVWISEYFLPGFTLIPKSYISAYEASLQRSTNTLASVVNTTTDYCGGDNSDARYLGKPVTALSRTEFRTYARNRKPGSPEWNCLVYEQYKTLYWLYVIEYADRNVQLPYNAQLTSEGYHQGGLGEGATNMGGGIPAIPCGATDSLGNGTGVVEYSDVETLAHTFVPRYRGIENPFGHIYKWCDGINVIKVGNDVQVHVAKNPALFSDTGNEGYTLVGNASPTSGWIKTVIFGNGGEIIAATVGGSSPQYFCDYFTSSGSTAINGVLFGGHTLDDARAGLACANAGSAPSGANPYVGSRLCFLPAA